jgi:hypothetical protein
MYNNVIDWIVENSPSKVSLLIRHSNRYPIPKGMIEHRDVPLTTEGRKLAYQFGKKLPKSYSIRLYYSPIPRCRETAEYLMKGIRNNYGSATLMGEKDFLYINLIDQREIVRILEKIGHHNFGYSWLKGKLDQGIIEPPQKVASKIIEGIITLMKKGIQNCIDIHITHDLNILSVRDVISSIKNENFDWPEYLDGIIVTQNEENVTLIWRDISKTIEKNYSHQ